MLVEVARDDDDDDDEEEEGSSEVGSSGEASLSEKVVLVLLAVEAGAVKEGALGSCHQGEFSVVPS